MGLNVDAPADRAGIRIQGNNKWMAIIQNAAKSENSTNDPRMAPAGGGR